MRRGSSGGGPHAESVSSELEELGKASQEFLSKRYGLGGLEISIRINRACLAWNVARDLVRRARAPRG
ncbi:MAG: hypothetical protein ABWK00_00515 [Desulfurococcaceae archaeon]